MDCEAVAPIQKNGRIIGQRYGTGFDATTPLLGWSMTKTVTAAIIGTLVRDGKMDAAKAANANLLAGLRKLRAARGESVPLPNRYDDIPAWLDQTCSDRIILLKRAQRACCLL